MYWLDSELLSDLVAKAHEMQVILDSLGPVKGVIKAKDKLAECLMWAQSTQACSS